MSCSVQEGIFIILGEGSLVWHPYMIIDLSFLGSCPVSPLFSSRSLPKHIRLGKRLCSECFIKKSQPVRKSIRLKAREHCQGSDVLQITVKSKSPGEVPSETDTGEWSSVDISAKNKSTDFQGGSCPNANFSSASDNACSESRLISQSMGMETAQRLNFIGSKSADESKYSLPCHEGSPLSKTLKLGISTDDFTNLSGDLLVRSKLTTPLITFSRKNKRKKDLDQADALRDSSPVENNCSLLARWSNSTHVNNSSAISHKGGSMDHSGHTELQGKDPDGGHLCCNEDKVCPCPYLIMLLCMHACKCL